MVALLHSHLRDYRRRPHTDFVMRTTVILLLWALSTAAVSAPHAHKEPVVMAPGYSPLSFRPPEPGTYGLPAMGSASNGSVLNSRGQSANLHDYLGDKPTVLSFIFTTCDDVNGCPLATYVMRRVQDALQADPETADKARLVSFSFDPVFDTPAVIDAYGSQFRADDFDWQFLTTSGAETLDPILNAYGQWVIRDYDDNGDYMGTMSHILRVFLIDKNRNIRNIYSTSFLHADTVANDVRSLLLEDNAALP
jgi:cytochrome c peroxidase